MRFLKTIIALSLFVLSFNSFSLSNVDKQDIASLNYITNSGAENGATGFISSPLSATVVDNADKHSGSRSLKSTLSNTEFVESSLTTIPYGLVPLFKLYYKTTSADFQMLVVNSLSVVVASQNLAACTSWCSAPELYPVIDFTKTYKIRILKSGAGSAVINLDDFLISNSSAQVFNATAIPYAGASGSLTDNVSGLYYVLGTNTLHATNLNVSGSATVPYAPNVPTNWNPAVTTLASALDQLGSKGLPTFNIAGSVVDQILTYNGSSWVNGNPSPTSAGKGVQLFLDDTASDIATYNKLLVYPNTAVAEQIDSVTTALPKALIEAYATSSTGIGSTSIEAGMWEFNTWSYTSNTTSTPTIYIDVYKRTHPAGTETLLFGVSFQVLSATNSLYTVRSTQSAFAINATDRLVVKYSAGTAGSSRTISFTHNGNSHYTYIVTPVVTRHNDLSGIDGGSATERYHLTNTEHGNISGAFAQSLLTTASPSFNAVTANTSILKGATSGTVTLQSPAAPTPYTLTMPTSDSTGTQFLQSDGSGILSWANATGVTTIGALDAGTETANGANSSGVNLYMQSADTTYPGLVNTTTQSMVGAKTFTSSISSPSHIVTGATSGAVTVTAPATVATPYAMVLPAAQGQAETALVNDGSGNLKYKVPRTMETMYQSTFETELPTTWSSGNNATFLGGGSLNGVISNDVSGNLNGATSFRYTQGSTSANDYIANPANINITNKIQGNWAGLNFWYKFDGTTDSVKVVVWDVTNSALISDSTWTLKNSATAIPFAKGFVWPTNCASIRIGFQVVTGSTSAILIVDDLLVSSDPFTTIAGGVEQASVAMVGYFPSTANCAWSRVSATLGDYTANTDCPAITITEQNIGTWSTVDSDLPQITATNLPSGKYVVTVNLVGQVGSGNYLQNAISDGTSASGSVGYASDATGYRMATIVGTFTYNSFQPTKTFKIQGASSTTQYIYNSPGTSSIPMTTNFHVVRYPIASTAANYITPAKSNLIDGTFYTPTYTGFGTVATSSAYWRQVGDSVEIDGSFVAGTTTAVEARISLPNSLISSSALPTLSYAGGAAVSSALAGQFNTLKEPSVGYFTFGIGSAARNSTDKVNAGILVSTGGTVTYHVKIPIQGWSGVSQFLAAIPSQQTCYLKDVKAQNTAGGTFTSGAWRTRDLNVINETGSTTTGTCSFATVSANRIALQGGTYRFYAQAPAAYVGGHQAVLYNITTAAIQLLGSTQTCTSAENMNSFSHIFGTLTINSPTVFELQHYCTITKTTEGLGRCANISSEVYTQVEITKVK